MIFLTTVTTVADVTTIIFFYLLSTFGKSNLTHLTTDVMFSGQCFALFAMFYVHFERNNFNHYIPEHNSFVWKHGKF